MTTTPRRIDRRESAAPALPAQRDRIRAASNRDAPSVSRLVAADA